MTPKKNFNTRKKIVRIAQKALPMESIVLTTADGKLFGADAPATQKEIKMSNNAMQLYGDRETVNEMAMRLVKAMPGAKKLAPEQARTLAQISVAHGLDPFNGEAWFIPGSGVMVGIKGLRKCAKKQLKATSGENASYWGKHHQVVDPTEYGAIEGDVVYEYRMRDTETFNSWMTAVLKMKEAGFSLDEAKAVIGTAPETVGIGILRAGEKTKMEKHQCARKRAEADAIKQRFDVEFLFSDSDNLFDDGGLPPIDIQISEPAKEPPSRSVSSLGFDADPASPQEVKEFIVRLSDDYGGREADIGFRSYIAGVLSAVFRDDKERYAVTEYLTGETSIKDVSDETVYAIRDWLAIDENNEPSDEAVKELRLILREALKEQGQLEMDV
jgi:hypothetical protein